MDARSISTVNAIWALDDKNDELERVLRDAESSCVLLRPSPRRFVLFPIQHRQIWDHYKSIEHSFWTAEDLHIDVSSFSRLPASSRARICALLDAQLDIAQQLRSSGIVDAFAGELQAAEARCYFGFQGMLENIHIEALSSTLLTLEPLSPAVSQQATVDVDPLLVACTSSRHSFMRRLLVYASVVDYYHTCTSGTSDFVQSEWPDLATLFSRLSCDIAACSQFTKLLCRMILPPHTVRRDWIAQLYIKVAAASVRAFPNLVQPTVGYRALAEAFSSALIQSTPSSPQTTAIPPAATTQPRRIHVFATDEDF